MPSRVEGWNGVAGAGLSSQKGGKGGNRRARSRQTCRLHFVSQIAGSIEGALTVTILHVIIIHGP